MSNYIETEVKFKILDVDKIIEQLKALGAKHINTEHQKTIRFDDQNKSLENKGIFIRVRSGKDNTLTMKIKNKDLVKENFFVREELETTVGDINTVGSIIKILGFLDEFIMEKYRMNWNYQDAKISIDEMPFGFFMEIESSNVETINLIADKLNLKGEDRFVVTYWDLFDEYKKANNINETNIVFEKDYSSKLEKL